MKEQIEKSGLPCVAANRFGGSRYMQKGRKSQELLTARDQRMLTIRQMTYTAFDT